eukprot:CAMPEP_0168551300 /NCGR_PEP_ID=MMETSP0413-20121227/6098_1 /TAXON_ID=136452 /ORGANISM="Filamoeba nolandi, Strain NC-AS-23-1" /LENGTH=171 /DNA_ID=CAMNT_0008581815 /DNA_START=31 /DNA_END=546 /DNA_ORIENTATION=-
MSIQFVFVLLFASSCFASPIFLTPIANGTYFIGYELVITIEDYNYSSPYDIYLMEKNGNTAIGTMIASQLDPNTTQYIYEIPTTTAEGNSYYIAVEYNCTLPLYCYTPSALFSILSVDQGSSSDSSRGEDKVRIAEYIGGGAVAGCILTCVVVGLVAACRRKGRNSYSPIA